LKYRGTENFEIRILCVEIKGFTFGYRITVPDKITALFYEASIRYRNNPAPSKKICDLEKNSVMTDRQTDRRTDTSRRRTDI